MIVCNFKKETETATLPTKHTVESAGIDFYSDTEIVIESGGSGVVSLGVSWNPYCFEKVPSFNISLIIQSRSGLAFKKNIEASNAGVIDQDYKGSVIKCKLYNNGSKPFIVGIGDKICQGVLHFTPKVIDVNVLDTERNGQGFGSSDAKEK